MFDSILKISRWNIEISRYKEPTDQAILKIYVFQFFRNPVWYLILLPTKSELQSSPLFCHTESRFFVIISGRIFQIEVRGVGGVENFTGGDFFTGGKEPEEEWFWRFETFTKLKTAFCEYWKSIKIKINMTKEYEIKTKIEQEHWLQLKMLFLLGYNWKLLFSGGWSWLLVERGRGIKIWWFERIFLVGGGGGAGEWANFRPVGGDSPPHPPTSIPLRRENP